MSVEQTARAWQQQTTSAAKLVLVCLADHANASGETSIGSATIERFTGLSVNTVRRALKELRDRGIVTWTSGEGPTAPRVFKL